MKLKKLIVAGALAVAGLIGATDVRANTVELTFLGLTGVDLDSNLSNGFEAWDYRYAARLTSNNYVKTGDTVTIFDFDAGTLATPVADFTPLSGASYSLTATTSGVNPSGTDLLNEGNDAAYNDYVFTFDGSTSPYLEGPGSTAPGVPLLGIFRIRSQYNTGAQDISRTQDHGVGGDGVIGGGDDTNTSDFKSIIVARSGGFTIPTPLPATATSGMALFSLLAARRGKRLAK